ncbi:MAG: SDR family NAD(P)-dependent oxidoreductase [Erysipelotrichaceae bacterium]|nr:SDR family NAD(P)-dependent oxidoreductase [Erysipelotrichaceae bacterium]
MQKKKRILITGSSGFIGASLCHRLLMEDGFCVVGVDNMNDYYSVALKQSRLKGLEEMNKDFTFVQGDISDKEFIETLFKENDFDIVVNLAAQAGVRYSIDHPDAYISSNIIGFYNILEAARNHPVSHLIYASSSSVYGNSDSVPFSVEDRTDRPVSLYAATKKSDELMAYTYSHLYHIPTTGLRFFTVYGPAGRPDMAYFSFTEKLLKGEKIRIFNYGNCERDFTYIDDIVEGIARIIEKGPIKEYNLYNIGNSHPENLMKFVEILGNALMENGLLPKDFVIQEHLDLVEMQPGDVLVTYSDTSTLEKDYGFHPDTPLEEGLRRFALWYKEYYRNKENEKENE